MRYLNLFLLVIFLNSCSNNIGCLRHERVKFNDLPKEVSHYIENHKEYKTEVPNMLVVLPIEKKKYYKFESIKTWTGPWVSHSEITDLKKNITFELDKGVPSPYIIFEDKLYISSRYNFLTIKYNKDSMYFTKYYLE